MKRVILAGLVVFGVAWPVRAQTGRPTPALEVGAGWAAFIDDAIVDHGALSGALRVHVTPRLSVGPEIVYMKGPGSDRDLVVTGNLTFDVRRAAGATPFRLTPFLVAGAGLFRNSSDLRGRRFSSTEGSFTAGGGVRIRVTNRLYAAADARVGWESHLRLSGIVGYRFGR